MAQGNGSSEPRLDRIERILDMVVADHVKFSDEHKQLLTAQIVLTDTVQTRRGTARGTTPYR